MTADPHIAVARALPSNQTPRTPIAKRAARDTTAPAVNETLRRTDNFKEFRERLADVQKGAESSAETPDPADVPPGEAWMVDADKGRCAAVKDMHDRHPWNIVTADGQFYAASNEDVTLIARLVPAPRAITPEMP